MVRKAIFGVVGLFALLLGGCVDPVDDDVAALVRWAQADPIFKDVTFSQVIAGGFESSDVSVGGAVNVDSVPGLFAALTALREKEVEAQGGDIRRFTSHVSADIGGTVFTWEGPFPDEKFAAEAAEIFAPFAADAVGKVDITATNSDGLFAARVLRAASISDSEARYFRDAAFGHLGPRGAHFSMFGFPAASPARMDGFPGWSAPAPKLLLDAGGTTYPALLDQIERVDNASEMFLYSVDNHGSHSVWHFYTDAPFDEGGIRAIKELLLQPVDGKTATVVVTGPDGDRGMAFVGQPRARQPHSDAPWAGQLQALLGAEE